MGQSFGALNTLALLTRTDRFNAAVITAAVQHPDLFADYLRGSSTGYYEKGKPVELRIYRGESHVISRSANVLDFWRRRLEFLARHLDLR